MSWSSFKTIRGSLVGSIFGTGGFSLLAGALALASCGGKKELAFVGAPDGSDGAVGANCGDRLVSGAEECDDGARADGDGCDGSCKVEAGWTCTGAPSSCVKCGNGQQEAGEECDDGNTDAGDGCSADCKIEGSCATPIPITLKADKDGLLGSVSASTSASDAGQVAEGPCAAQQAGAGADRVFQFELPGAADLQVRVGSNFDAIVRLSTKACDLKSEAPNGCVDGAAVSGQERLELNDAKAGTYYVVVDGKTAKQAGDFSVEVEARCPLSSVKIDHVILNEPFRTVLFNTNHTCGVDLSRLGIYAQPEAADTPATLPADTLGPLSRTLLTSESPPPGNTTYQGNIKYDSQGYAGAFYVCRGKCDTVNGNNVLDAFRWKGASGALAVKPLKAIKFTADAAALTDRLNTSYWRVATDNVAPTFAGTDFVDAYFVETFEDGTMGGWEPAPTLFYKPKLEKVDGTVGAFSLTLDGGNPLATVWNGPRHVFKDAAGKDTSIAPTEVSVRVRGTDKVASQGWVFFGNKGAQGTGFGSYFRENGTLGFGVPLAFAFAYSVNTWYSVQYKVTYTATAGTAAVSVDGKSDATWNVPFGATTVSEINLRSLLKDTSFGLDQIIVR